MKTLAILIALLISNCLFAQIAFDNVPADSISVESIGRKITLIGRLGKPLGTMAVIRGKWECPDQSGGATKDKSLRFYITHVDEKKLNPMVVINYGDIHVYKSLGESIIPPYDKLSEIEGEEWELNGYESGQFSQAPVEFYTALGTGPPAMLWQPAFVSQIYAVKLESQNNGMHTKPPNARSIEPKSYPAAR